MNNSVQELIQKAQKKVGNSQKEKRVRLMMTLVAMAMTVWGLTGCERKQDVSALTCQDDPTGRSQEEKQAIGDACFKSGTYTKSPPKKW